MKNYDQEAHSFEGFETWFNAFKMKLKMYRVVFLLFIILVLIFWFVGIYATWNNKSDVACRWVVAKGINTIRSNSKIVFRYENGHREKVPVWAIVQTSWIEKTAKKELHRIFMNLLKACSLFLFYPVIILSFKDRASKQSSKRYIRGAKLDTQEEFYQKVKKNKEKLDIPFGQIKQPYLAEPKHTFIIGKSGSGKTVCMSQILNRIKERGGKGIVYDFKGDYIQKFYNPEQDIIFNPLDKRSIGWNLFNELETKPDIEANVASLIPDDPKETPFWATGSRTVLKGILESLYQDNKRSNRHIWQTVIDDAPKLINRLSLTESGMAGQRFIGTGESNQSLGILAKLMQHTLCFQYMADNDGDFSVKKWLYDDKPGMIFISNYAEIRDTLKPILSLFIDTVGRRLLSMPDNLSRRRFIMLDEFATLQKMPVLVELLTGSRSKGGCVYIGVQDYGNIDEIYTEKLRNSIVGSCSNQVVFNLAGESAKIASERMDKYQFSEATRTQNMGVQNWRDGISLNERKDKEVLMFPSEIEALPDMRGVVKFNNYNRVISNWYDPENPSRPKTIFPDINEHFQMRSDMLLKNVMAEQQEIMDELDDLDVTFDIDDSEVSEEQQTEG